MKKEKRKQLATIIEAYQGVLLIQKRKNEPIDWQSVDSFLSFLRDEINKPQIRVKLNKNREE